MSNIVTSSDEYINAAMLKNIHKPRVIIFCIILFFALTMTISQPDFLITYFGSKCDQYLTRIWIISAMLVTFVITIWINIVSVEKRGKDCIEAQSSKHLSNLFYTQAVNIILNIIIVLIAFTVIIMAVFNVSLVLVNFVSGITLVTLITIYDAYLAKESRILLDKVYSDIKNGNHENNLNHKNEKLKNYKKRYINDNDVVWKLDIPILIGISMTWIIGYMILPNALPDKEMIYANGFAAGANALQLIIGNISFEIFSAFRS